MKRSVDKIIITNLPSFYKINLYNEINKRCKLLVIYTGDHSEGRNNDFYKGQMHFNHIFLNNGRIQRLLELRSIIRSHKYDELIIGGWDSLPLWLGTLISPKRKNALVVESSYLESTTRGLKGLLKRLFVSRISKVYASGRSQRKITDNLGFTGTTIITKGVGVFNYIKQPAYTPRREVKNFIYVGRLTKVKNIEFIVERFNRHPELNLTIIGFGELEECLRSVANSNIRFLGAINNSDLPRYYQEADVFILPSLKEPWGLVVEEALNNGIPVMVSNKVGCAEEIVTPDNGVVFSLNTDDFEDKLSIIRDIDNYNKMRAYIATMDFNAIEKNQIDCYIK